MMQYILSQEEYDGLLLKIKEAKATREKIVNELCQMVANHMPITTYPGSPGDPEPWGCYKSKDYEWYCDNCPVVEYCGMNRRYSK